MIVDHISNAGLYNCHHERLATAIKYLSETDFSVVESNTSHTIEGENIFFSINEYQTKPLEKGLWEAHRDYIDIHYVVEGIEQIGYAYIGNLEISKEYDAKDDYLLLKGSGSMVNIQSGTFAIFYPQDAHMTGIAPDTQATVKKVIMKIRV
ncbi:Toxin-antitoxin biofilm protein TabA [compost metagenome]